MSFMSLDKDNMRYTSSVNICLVYQDKSFEGNKTPFFQNRFTHRDTQYRTNSEFFIYLFALSLNNEILRTKNSLKVSIHV